MQVAKNRYSGDLGIVPLDFDKDALSYQSKKKSKKQDEPEKLLDECFHEYSLEETHSDISQRSKGSKNRNSKKENVDNFLNDILNINRTR